MDRGDPMAISNGANSSIKALLVSFEYVLTDLRPIGSVTYFKGNFSTQMEETSLWWDSKLTWCSEPFRPVSASNVFPDSRDRISVLASNPFQFDPKAIAHVGDGTGYDQFAVCAKADLTGDLRRNLRILRKVEQP